jgi:hypothetical protein
VIRTFEVALTIPDNTAYTALTALERLGVACDELQRAEVYVFDVADAAAPGLEATLETIETVYNPNKHVLRARAGAPAAGELWVGDVPLPGGAPSGGKEPSMTTFSIAGRPLEGVRSLKRFTSWRLKREGRDVAPAVAQAAADALLVNPAFQQATVGR